MCNDIECIKFNTHVFITLEKLLLYSSKISSLPYFNACVILKSEYLLETIFKELVKFKQTKQ